ncbi:MAG: hypothetical protein M1820_010268 [Bogoriella megaspora]|nr:MAG: hypothetical protein M1820_010268 [Bogoriella megaspora]
MATLLDPPRNLSYYAIPAAWFLTMAPHAYGAFLASKSSRGGVDRTKPRTLVPALESDQSLDNATKDTIVRAEGAHSNGLENLGLFASAVVAGNVAGLDTGYLNALSGAYLASRVIYNVVYVTGTNTVFASMRSLLWMTGVGCCFAMLVGAGNRASR